MEAKFYRTSYCVNLTFTVDGDVSKSEFMSEILSVQAGKSARGKNLDVWISIAGIKKFRSCASANTSMFEVPIIIWSLSQSAKLEFEQTLHDLFDHFYGVPASYIEESLFDEWLHKTTNIFWPGS